MLKDTTEIEAVAGTDRATQALLEVRGLRTDFCGDSGTVSAVDGVSLAIPPRATVGLVGESGCGKSVTALSIMRLLPEPVGRIASGRILLRESPDAAPTDLARTCERELTRIRGRRVAMIFQEPLSALNPVLSVGRQIIEAVELHESLRGRAARERAVDLLRRVGIAEPQKRIDDYPHELSGGMRQRVMIAMALACRPLLLIADEPTTALDVTVQAQILALLQSLQDETGMSILLITHDLGVVAQAADYVYVMYAGRIVEHGPAPAVFAEPLHPYTQGLLRCTPRIGRRENRRLEVIPGSVPDPARMPSGCRFHPRCSLTAELARRGERETLQAEETAPRRVLKRCVEGEVPGGVGAPELREWRGGHFAGCWEVDSAGSQPV